MPKGSRARTTSSKALPACHGKEGHGEEGHGEEGHSKLGHGKEGHSKEGHGKMVRRAIVRRAMVRRAVVSGAMVRRRYLEGGAPYLECGALLSRLGDAERYREI